jgi:hypothetical protein
MDRMAVDLDSHHFERDNHHFAVDNRRFAKEGTLLLKSRHFECMDYHHMVVGQTMDSHWDHQKYRNHLVYKDFHLEDWNLECTDCPSLRSYLDYYHMVLTYSVDNF